MAQRKATYVKFAKTYLAAALAAESGTAVQDIPYAALAARLAADGQVLSCERKGAQ